MPAASLERGMPVTQSGQPAVSGYEAVHISREFRPLRRCYAQAQALLHQTHSGPPIAADVALEAVAGLLDEEDEDGDAGYGQIMLSMTRNPRRQRPVPPG